MLCFLRPDVHLAKAGDDLVILDLANDAYLALRGMGGRCLAATDGRLFGDVDAVDALHAAGLLTPSRPARARGEAPIWTPPVRDLLDCDARVPPGAAIGEARELALSALLFARRPVRRLLGPSPWKTPPGRRRESESLMQAAVLFRHVSSYSPWSGECLFNAFALRRRLRSHGLDATWVFGVRTWPFEAHCWLQVGDLVLNDAAERLVSFVPILVV